MSNLSIPNGIHRGRMLSFAGTKLQMLMTTTVLCSLKSISKEKNSGYSVRDCVSSGTTNSAFSISLLFRLFLLVLSEFSFEMILSCRTETIFYQIASILLFSFSSYKR